MASRVLFAASLLAAGVGVLLGTVPVDKFPPLVGKIACQVSVTYCQTDALHAAVIAGKVAAVKKLLASGVANPRVRDAVCASTPL